MPLAELRVRDGAGGVSMQCGAGVLRQCTHRSDAGSTGVSSMPAAASSACNAAQDETQSPITHLRPREPHKETYGAATRRRLECDLRCGSTVQPCAGSALRCGSPAPVQPCGAAALRCGSPALWCGSTVQPCTRPGIRASDAWLPCDAGLWTVRLALPLSRVIGAAFEPCDWRCL
eukprot:293961-Chlamydomonas_euryale.AAC.2